MPQTLIQTQPLVNLETERGRVHNILVDTLATYCLETDRVSEWQYLYPIWVEAWSNDRGIDLSGFPTPAAPVAFNEDAADWFTSVSTGINQF